MKKSLLDPKPLIISLVIAILFLFNSSAGFAAVKTWAGGTGAGKNWTTGANWSGGTAPAPNDDIIFNTPTPGLPITFSVMPGNVTYGSLLINDGTVIFVHTSAMTMTLGSAADPDFEILFAGNLTLGTNVNITLAASAFARVSGNFTINAGSTYNTDAASALTNVFGVVTNKGTITCTTASKLLISGGSVYNHNQNGGNFPTATWDINSSCTLTALTTTHPTNGNQTFGNLSYTCPGMTTDLAMANGAAVANSLTVDNTGTARLLLTAGSFTIGGDLNISFTGSMVISNATDRTLTVTGGVFNSGGVLNLCIGGATNVGTLNVGSNFNNFGTINATGAAGCKGVINFNGNTAQNFNQSGSLLNTIDFIVNKVAAGVTFASSTTILGSLTLTNGLLNIPSGITLTINNGSVIGGSGFGTTKHIATLVDYGTGVKSILKIKNMAAGVPYVIPVGDGTNYLPVTLTPANINEYDICAFNGITTNGEPNGTAFSAAQKLNCVNAVWSVNLISGGAGAGVTMTLGWPAVLEGSTFSTYSALQIGISHWDGPNWGNCSGSGNNVTNVATRTGITVFSPFAVGKTPYVLPVKFSYLNIAKGNGYNSLNWKATCNSSEVTFAVERSTDGRNFSEINSITASQLRCAQPFDYVDNNNLSGTIFYRIRSTEITGIITYSNIVKVTDQQKDMLLTAVLPNPVMDQAQLSISTAKKDMVDLVIVSMEGKVVQHSSVQLQAGSSIINLDVAALQKGMYMIRGTFSDGQTSTIKFTKQ